MAPPPHVLTGTEDGAVIANSPGLGWGEACSPSPVVQRGSSAGSQPPANPAVTCSLLQLQPQPVLQQLQGNLLPRPPGPPEVQGDLVDGVATKVAADTEGSHSAFPPEMNC